MLIFLEIREIWTILVEPKAVCCGSIFTLLWQPFALLQNVIGNTISDDGLIVTSEHHHKSGETVRATTMAPKT
jgi:hypothetical protein